MLQSKGLLTTWVRKGVYSCGKEVPITWLAPGRAAAGSQQTPPEVQICTPSNHPEPSRPPILPAHLLHAQALSPNRRLCKTGGLGEMGTYPRIYPDDQGVQDMAWEGGVPGPLCWLHKGHRPSKLQGSGPLGKQRPDQTVPGQGHFLRKEGSEHSPVGGSGEAQP